MDGYNPNSPEIPGPTTQSTPDTAHSTEANRPVMDDSAGNLFDWGELLEFTYDDQFIAPFSPTPVPQPPPPPVLSVVSDRVRKRDPRLICENFLAGRVPCACPEVDERLAELEEAESGGPGKKRARTARIGVGKARCQVPGCEVDISELKGYHKRHRVCLSCANSASVLIDGESRRYCQQCGKFHMLSDFDEGKRSCRRKLERHNDRRRRKQTTSSKDSAEKESQETLLGDDISCDVEAGKGIETISLSNQSAEKEELFEFEDGDNPNQCSVPSSHAVHSDSVLSLGASDGGKDSSKCGISSTFGDNKSTYSSTCPTGRISFKLYDWNPAEFPRRLRHQIFQWLASMPVELEGYIRPGCTILTVFVAMPNFMWVKLFEDPVSYLKNFVTAPGRPLSGKGTAIVYLNHMIFPMSSDRTSLTKINSQVRAPRLSYVHPTCFEAGKAMEFVACGSNLLQPKFRFLISFAGKYLTHQSYVSLSRSESGSESSSLDRQLYKIYVPRTESNMTGPAFIEVENESGLSNFIPILIGSKEICSEMEILQQHHESLVLSNGPGVSVTQQTPLSEFILDIGWLLKEPAMEAIQKPFSSQIQRYNYILEFLLFSDSTVILERVLQSLKGMISNSQMSSPVGCVIDSDIRLLQQNLDKAMDILFQKRLGLGLQSQCFVEEQNILSQSGSQDGMRSIAPGRSEDMEVGGNWQSHAEVSSVCPVGGSTVPFLDGEFVNSNHNKKLRKRPSSLIVSRTGAVLNSRPTVFVIAIAIVCFGVCAVIFHPGKVSGFAVTIRRCLFDD